MIRRLMTFAFVLFCSFPWVAGGAQEPRTRVFSNEQNFPMFVAERVGLAGRTDAGDAIPVKVMSFNIRFGTAKDGENHWDKRKAFLADTIKAFAPDLLGTQETLDFQRDYLSGNLPDHAGFAAGRDDGKDKGEMAAVFWRKNRFDRQDGGHFWLSQTPDKPGSKGWDAALPRIVTWVKLAERKTPNAKPILFINTHFDHLGKKARIESAKLLRKQMAELGVGCSVIATGDFNAAVDSEPYKNLFGALDGKESLIVDTFRVLHPQKVKGIGTSSGFRADKTGGNRIDWIGCSRDWTIQSAEIDRTAKDGRTPSDHFPVTTILKR
jgi:endonuclease/exonuclease/phosphatase family metal-dependent hydrolase